MTEEAQFIIIEDKYTLSIIKNDKSNNKKPKDGISIFKKQPGKGMAPEPAHVDP